MQKYLLASVLATLSVWAPLQGAAQSGKNRIAPCSLLTAADAQHITGVPMKNVPPPGGAALAAFGCSYEQTETTTGPKIEVIIVAGQHKSKDVEDMMWSAAKSGAESRGKLDTQPGIGDEAFLLHGKAPGGGLSTTLVVRKGTSDFNVQANGLKSEPIAALKEVAKKIADRL